MLIIYVSKAQGEWNVKAPLKTTQKMLRLYSLYISVRWSVTLPDAVKLGYFYLLAGRAQIIF
jgi:hypothetical protein